MRSKEMCTYRAAISRFAFKGVEQFIRQGLEKRLCDFELILCETDRPLGFSGRGQPANLSHGRIPFAQEDSFSFRKPIQVFRKMGFGLMNVQPDHGSLLNYRVN